MTSSSPTTSISSLKEAFHKAQQAGRVLFFPEFIYGWPNRQLSEQALAYAAQFEHVVIKIPTPVMENHPSNTSDIILKAHRHAVANGYGVPEALAALERYRPNFLVVYADAVTGSIEEFLQECTGKVDSLIFTEGIAGAESLLQSKGFPLHQSKRLSQQYGIDIVRIIYAGFEDTFAEPVKNSSGFLYLAVSQVPGGKIVAREMLDTAVRCSQAIDELPLMAGFGIKTAAYAREMANIPGIAGITVGSWLTAALGEGFEQFQRVFDGLYEALDVENSV